VKKVDHVDEAMLRWKDAPWLFVLDNFQVTPDPWQLDALHLVAKKETRRLALKACKGPGKTTVLAWIIWWFLATRFHAKIGCTSITEANIDTNLWPELAKWQAVSPFLASAFVWSRTTIARRSAPENWFAVKRTWPKSGDQQQQSDALAGIHADHVMFVLDESGGIPQAVMVTAEAVLATEGSEAKVIQAGNPTHTTGPLYRACTSERHLWEVVTITGDPDNVKRSTRISLDWAREQIALYGRDNPWVQVNVLGEFPPSSINALLGVEEVERAMHRHLRIDTYNWAQKRIGVDVARFGDDRTVIFPRQGLASFRPVSMRNARTNEIAARVVLGCQRWGAELIFVDDTGHWGHGVIDNLITVGMPVIAVVYSGKSTDPRFKNKRAEMWMKGAEAIKNGAALPLVPEMVGELTEPTYTFVNGQFQLEEKDQIKARLGRSPDLADAYMQTYAMEELPSDLVQRARGSQHTLHDFDPYARRSPQDDGTTLHDFDPVSVR
jgi:hypothetical protein